MSKRSKRQKQREHLKLIEAADEYNYSSSSKKRIQQTNVYKNPVEISPRNIKQCNLMSMLQNKNTHIAFAIGPAGTGKTLLSTLYAINCLKSHVVKKVVITRPAVSVDEKHGFLPGTLVEKMSPWTRPIFDIFEEHFSPGQIEQMVASGKIEIAPLAYMRGRTFKDSIIIADEMQNATDSQMKMLLTRIGEGSKIIITGDLAQHDRGFDSNGLKLFVERLLIARSEMIDVVEFDPSDVDRHPAVSDVLRIYGDLNIDERQQQSNIL